jgi:tRNA(fMet)-specific endonuclease VapC
MKRVAVDTDVFSFTLKSDHRARAYFKDPRDAALCLSFMTLGELRLWGIMRRWRQTRMTALENAVEKCVVFPPDDQTVTMWADITAKCRQLGRPISCGDAWIAATAVRHQLPLVTHNRQDFAPVAGLKVISYG